MCWLLSLICKKHRLKMNGNGMSTDFPIRFVWIWYFCALITVVVRRCVFVFDCFDFASAFPKRHGVTDRGRCAIMAVKIGAILGLVVLNMRCKLKHINRGESMKRCVLQQLHICALCVKMNGVILFSWHSINMNETLGGWDTGLVAFDFSNDVGLRCSWTRASGRWIEMQMSAIFRFP